MSIDMETDERIENDAVTPDLPEGDGALPPVVSPPDDGDQRQPEPPAAGMPTDIGFDWQAEARAKQQEYENRRRNLREQIQAKRGQVADLEKDIISLEDAERQFSGAVQGLGELLNAGQQSGGPLIPGAPPPYTPLNRQQRREMERQRHRER